MSQDVRHYRLPENASAADRSTLRLWKTWITWLRPIILAIVFMVAVSAIAGTTIAKSGGHVAVWSPANYAGVAPVNGEPDSEDSAWARGLVAQLVAVLAATGVAFPVLHRSVHPAAVGVISGVAVVALHLTLSNQWSLRPIAMAPSSYQALAVVLLWVLPVVAGVTGMLIERGRLSDG